MIEAISGQTDEFRKTMLELRKRNEDDILPQIEKLIESGDQLDKRIEAIKIKDIVELKT